MTLIDRARSSLNALRNRPSHLLPVSTYFGYGVGQVGGQIMRDTPALLLPFFMTNVLGLAAGLASLAILIPKIWVFFADPLFGVVSDKTQTRWGRRRPFILFGGLFAGISFFFLFYVPGITSQIMLAAYMTVMFALMSTGFSSFSVTYLTMASEMSDDPDERTTILSFRNTALNVGLLAAGAMAPRLISWAGGGRDGYEMMGFILGSIIIISTLSVFFGTAKVRTSTANESTMPLREQIRVAAQNKPFLTLIAANIIQYISAGIGYAGIVYYITFIVQVNALEILSTAIILMAVFSSLTMPTWVYFAARFGKLRTYTWSLILFSITTQVWFLAGPDTLWPVYVAALVIGYFNTGFILMSFSCLTDTIEFDRMRSGLSREGAFSAVYSATEKISFAIGSSLFVMILGIAGFVESQGEVVAQPDSALWGIRIGFVILPAVLHLLSLLILRKYTLTNETLKSMSREAAEASPAE